jgi:signal transduction histidine kinase
MTRASARPVEPWIVDLAIVGLVAFPTLMDAWWNEEGTRQADGWTFALAGVSLVALLGRRRWPMPVAFVCGLALTGWYVLGHHGELLNLPTMVALYSVATTSNRRTTVAVGVLAAAWSGVLGFTSDDPIGARGGSPVLEMLWPLVPLALGEAARTRHELVALAAAEREGEAQRRVEAERVQIAREVHDVVAHTLSAVHVQLGVAVETFDGQPRTAREAIGSARASTKQALAELRGALASLRDPAIEARAPLPGVAELPGLIDTTRRAGVCVDVDHGSLGDLPQTVELAIYRIVQEALTNVVRHSRATTAAVQLTRDHDAIEIVVADDGTGPPRGGGARGHGLRGMAERAAALGGTCTVGAPAGGGFEVRAHLPIPVEP